MIRVALVGCGKAKQKGKHRAEDLYIGNLFRASLKHAKATADKVFIVSAFYGLLPLDREIYWYDRALGDLAKGQRVEWGMNIAHSLYQEVRQMNQWSSYSVVIYASAMYAQHISRGIHLGSSAEVHQPLKGLMLGERLQWFKQQEAKR